MRKAVTIRLNRKLDQMLTKFCSQSRRKRSEVVRDALRRQLSLMTFEQLRHKVMLFAEASGLLTDKDVIDVITRKNVRRRG